MKIKVRSMLFLVCSTVLVAFASPGLARQRAEKQLAKQVDALFAEWDKPGSPGCALGVIRDGNLIYERGYGMANLEYGIPITAKSVFDIGSTSKQFTAASIVLLAQQSKLSLDDDIRKFIPELPDYGKKIAIRNLLNHTSGIRDYLNLMAMRGVNFDDATDDDDALRLIVRQKKPNFDPGEEFLYSNSGYFLLSEIVKRASGKSLAQFAADNIFKPLGMQHTHFHDDHTMIVPLRATGYSPSETGFRIEMSNFEQTGDGAVNTTVEDLLLWDRNFYDPKVGGRSMYDELIRQGVLNNGKKLDYAEGLMIDDYRGLRMIHHGGSWAGYRAEFIRIPEERFSVICLSNLATFNPSKLARKVVDIYLADRLKPANQDQSVKAGATISLNESELKAKAGAYRDPKTGLILKVFPLGDRLMIDYAGVLKFQAVPVSANSFRSVGAPVDIGFEFEGSASAKLIARIETEEPTTLDRIEIVKPTPAQLAEYAGDYYSGELDVTYRVEQKEYQLSVAIGSRGKSRPLEPGIKDVFSMRGTEIHFTRADGRVTGFDLNAGRVRGISFVRR